MRLATWLVDGRHTVVIVRGQYVLPVVADDPAFGSVRTLAAGGRPALQRLADWAEDQPDRAYRPVEEGELAAVVPDPGAVYTIGLNYHTPGEPDGPTPSRPLVYGKATTSVTGHLATVTWDRSLTDNVDPECELGVVIGAEAAAVTPDEAMSHVFGYTIINDISSRDPWLDGDQWLLGKSMPGFCPVGPWVVTADELVPDDLGLGCMINGVAIQDRRSSQMRTGIPELISYLSRHVTLRPGDLIATGTPERLGDPPGPDRHLEAGDEVTAWIEGIGRLTTIIG